ncbi:hypothetical protein [Shewanella violacea]|uniref:Uncharacterized protein n=1 Tax=Shewanella violacea (strain JCM 10179 / CIP 106290 / LMG 19151 / DSS12) TaxID=637905 RepID=D4ZJS3_SHEVD|nr:hypothetical protein [Shewanella violacea]BAJ01922.1 hypothetical protein SVI_1951 [Shewanella violacea DSS12]
MAQYGNKLIFTLAKLVEISCSDNDIKAHVDGDKFIIMSLFYYETPYKQVLSELSLRVIGNDARLSSSTTLKA